MSRWDRERISRALLLLTLACLPIGTVLRFGSSAESPFLVPKLYLVEILAAGAGVVWLLAHPADRQLPRSHWLIRLVILYAFLSALWAPRPDLAIAAAVHLAVAWILLCALRGAFRDNHFRQQAAFVFLGVAVVEAAWGIGQFLIQHDFGLQRLGESVLSPNHPGVAKILSEGRRSIRAYGSLPHPNILAAYLAAGLFLAGAPIFWLRHRRNLLAVALVMMGAGLLVTFSRTALLVTAVNGLFVIIFSIRRWHRLPASAAAAAVATVIIGAILTQPLASRTALNGPQETGVTNRTVGYQAAAELIFHHPWGVGAGNFVPAMEKLRPGLPSYQYQPAHDVPLLIAAELGVLPALVILAYVIQLGWRFHVHRPDNDITNTTNFAIFMLGGVFIAMGTVDHFWWSTVPGLLLLVTFAALVESRLPRPASGLLR